MKYTAILRGVTIGEGTIYPWPAAAPPQGFGPGVFDAPRTRLQWTDGARPSGPDTLPSKVWVFETLIRTAPEAMEAAVDVLSAAWAPVRTGMVELRLTMLADERVIFGRPVSATFDLSQMPYQVGRARLAFEALDPRTFSAVESSIVLGLTEGGGFTFPLTFPLTFGVGSDSDGSVVNAGNTDAPWWAVFVGPVSTPRVALGSTGRFVEFAGTVPAGSMLTVDSLTQSVLLDGSPRRETQASTWWELPPGTSTIRYRAASGSGSCTFGWRSAKL